jgi:8-oxo-dGTP diphosphatase
VAQGMATARARRDVSLVRAAGGLVVRDGEVLLVHRPQYDDWTFPKGKCKDGETDEACALREVREETGLVCRLAGEAGTTEYVDSRGRPKLVHWWLMEPQQGEFTPNDEVDDVRWAEPADAAKLLSYDRDLALLDTLP